MRLTHEWRTYCDNGMGFRPTITAWKEGLPEEENFGLWSTVQVREVIYFVGKTFIGNTWDFNTYEEFRKHFFEIPWQIAQERLRAR